MTDSPRRSHRLFAGALAGAVAVAMMPVLGFTGTAGAAALEPTGDDSVCEDAPDNEPFTDIGANDPANDEIDCMINVEPEITKGTTATTYGPNAHVTRRQMALFLFRLAGVAEANEIDDEVTALPAGDGEVEFSDIEPNDEAFAEIDALSDAGVAEGLPDGSFGPRRAVTRRQMAKFLVRLQEVLAGEAITPDDPPNAFPDDEGDSGEDELDILAAEGVFEGNADGNVDPGGNITRRQMALVLTRTLQHFFEKGVIDRLFAEDDTNQTINVEPHDAVTQDLSEDDDRDYTATDLTAGQPYRITLFDSRTVTVDENDFVTFRVATPTSGDCAGTRIARAGPPGAALTFVNGSAVMPNPDHTWGGVTPVNGSLTFRIEGSTTESVIPVVFVDNDATGCTSLEVDASGVPIEAFGLGGQTTFLPAESSGGPFNGEVGFVDKSADLFVAGNNRYDYDSGDNYAIDGVPSSFAQFEAALSSSDAVSGVYAPEPDLTSNFQLNNDNPGTPTAVAASRSESAVAIAWTRSDDDLDGFRIYRALSGNGTDCAAATTPAGSYAVVGTDSASPFTDSTVQIPEQYCYRVTEVNDGDEGDRSAPAFIALNATDATAPTITQAKAVEDGGFSGQVDGGDVHRFIFSEPMKGTIDDDGSAYQVESGSLTITCGGSGTTCVLNPSAVTIGGVERPAGTVLTVTLGSGVLPLPPTSYPVTINSVTAQWDDTTGNQLNLAGSDKMIEVDEA